MRSSIPTSCRPPDRDTCLYLVAIPFKWGQVFQRALGYQVLLAGEKSQSLLNEVKYSNLKKGVNDPLHIICVAIPFKWGQVFQQNELENVDVIALWVAIPFKWGQVFQLLKGIAKKHGIKKVAIPFKWGQVFQPAGFVTYWFLIIFLGHFS